MDILKLLLKAKKEFDTSGIENGDVDGIKWWNSLSKEEQARRIKHHGKTGRWDDNKPI